MVFVTFRAAVFMKMEVTTLFHTQQLLWTQVYILAALATVQHNNWSHNGDVNPKTYLDKTGVLTFNTERQKGSL